MKNPFQASLFGEWADDNTHMYLQEEFSSVYSLVECVSRDEVPARMGEPDAPR